MRRWLALLTSCFWLWGFHCGEPAAESSTPAAAPKPSLRLLVLTDPRGYLEPCGCQTRPLGGVDRLAAAVKRLRAEGTPLLVLAAGDLTQGGHLSSEDVKAARNQEEWRAQTLVDIWSRIGLAAVTPGPLDFRSGTNELQALLTRSQFPWIADNLEAPQVPGLRHAQLLTAGDLRVGVMGLVTDGLVEPMPSVVRIDRDVRAQAERAARSLREQGASVVVALVVGDRRTAKSVALKGVDVVVMAGLNQEQPVAPARHGDTVVVHAGREGQRLLVLDLGLRQGGPFQDASAWTQEVDRRALESQLSELKGKLAEWEKDPKIKPSDLSAQRERLAALERERDQPHRPDYSGRWFNARIVELDDKVAEEHEIDALMKAFDKRVNEHNRVALADILPKPVAAGAPKYVGSEACQPCHAAAYGWWRGTKHGQAYATLEQVSKEFNLACVGCHVTGYNQPGGSTVAHVDGLKDVGCENCHGPSSAHVASPDAPGLTRRDTEESVCRDCHNRDHSARFVYVGFKAMLMAPGHGLPEK